VNPQPGAPEPATASASLINYDVQTFTRLSLTGPGGSAFDAIRIGSTFADVAPAVSDFNGDGKVDHFDYATWKINFGLTGALPEEGDANNDSDADGGDFLVWQRQRGFVQPTSASVIPEPASHLALLAGLILAFGRRRVS
jgi:hypothetical protein